MKYYILCNGIPLLDNDLKGLLEFKSFNDAGEYIADLDGENTFPLKVVDENNTAVRKVKGLL